MINRIKRNIFPAIIALSAISVSGSAAFYSVSGLSKLFAGASFEVIIMAGSLEVAKLVIASLLYQYWDTINKWLRTYLTIATLTLIIITSIGIYGFLSAAYQQTYQKLTINDNKIEFLEDKSTYYEKDIQRYDSELESILNSINNLSSAKATSIQVKDTTLASGFRQTVSTAELRLAQQRLEVEEQNRTRVMQRRDIASDSLQKYKLEILGLQNNSDTTAELGPLKYLSGLTNTPMDKIINILLLVIIFVFDPLAISLVIAANFAFNHVNRKTLYGEYEDEYWSNDKTDHSTSSKANKERLDESLKELEEEDKEEDYNEVTKPEDFIVVESTEIPHPVQILQKGPSTHRVLFSDGTEKKIDKDDNIIRYM